MIAATIVAGIIALFIAATVISYCLLMARVLPCDPERDL